MVLSVIFLCLCILKTNRWFILIDKCRTNRVSGWNTKYVTKVCFRVTCVTTIVVIIELHVAGRIYIHVITLCGEDKCLQLVYVCNVILLTLLYSDTLRIFTIGQTLYYWVKSEIVPLFEIR